jgi:threonine aldolase
MSNQVALRVLTRPGDDVIVSVGSHTVLHETGASGANSGIQFTSVGEKGIFNAEEFLSAIKPRGHIIYPPTTLVEIENTHNRAGGIVFPQQEAKQICEAAKHHDIATYLDGARLWNAAVASGSSPASLAAPFDLVSVAFSKGLGAPGGSMLAGSKDLIRSCSRYRRMMGGAMRQVGIFAAACLYALDHHLDRLAEDHAHARLIADRLSAHERILLDPETVQTNILIFELTEEAPDAPKVVELAGEKGLLIFAFGPRTIRLVTHRDVSRAQCEKAAEILLQIVSGR